MRCFFFVPAQGITGVRGLGLKPGALRAVAAGGARRLARALECPHPGPLTHVGGRVVPLAAD